MSFQLSPETSQAQAQAQEQRAKIEEAKRKAEESKKQVEESRQSLLTARQKLPERTSQKALRSKMAGVTGRNVRRQILGVETEIEGKVGEIGKYEKEVLNPFEKEISEADVQLKSYESQVSDAVAGEFKVTVIFEPIIAS
jgi:chromosome segregation ATPase